MTEETIDQNPPEETDLEEVAEPEQPALFDEDDQESETTEQPEQTETTEEPAPRENRTFSEMRKNFKGALNDKRRLEKELEELRAKLPPAQKELGPEPTLDQFDYDEVKFRAEYRSWWDRKAEQDREDSKKLDAQRKEQEALEDFKKSYAARAKSLGVDDFEEAESEVGALLNQTQAGLVMRGADDPASLVYALAKSPGRLMDLAKITDPVKFTAAVVKLELSLATKKNSKPAPESRMTAERTSTGFNAGSATLQKLRDKAAATGDFSEVVKYKRENGIN